MACAKPAKQHFFESPNPPIRLSFHGFSLLPPEQANWVLVRNTNNKLDLAKPGLHKDETYTIQLWLIKLPVIKDNGHFLDHIKQGLELEPKQSRFQLIKNRWQTATKQNNLPCVRFDKIMIDTNPKRSSTRKDPMTLYIAGLTCSHPSSDRYAVQLAYSYRHYAEHPNAEFAVPEFTAQAQRLFKNFNIITD